VKELDLLQYVVQRDEIVLHGLQHTHGFSLDGGLHQRVQGIVGAELDS
jgi:hypothetical protein